MLIYSPPLRGQHYFCLKLFARESTKLRVYRYLGAERLIFTIFNVEMAQISPKIHENSSKFLRKYTFLFDQ